MGSEVVGGFAVFGVVESLDLGLFRDAEAAADDFGDAEGDGGCGAAPEDGDDDGFGLDPELGTDGAGFAALAAEGFRAEDAGEEGTDDAADTVDAEDVERVVVTEGVLEFGGAEVAEDAGGGSDGNGTHGSAGAAGGGDGDEAGDGSGGDADGGGFAADDPLKGHPGDDGGGGGDLGDEHGHAGGAVGGEGAACVEAEPADPEESGSDDGEGDLVRVHGGLAEAATFSNGKTADEAGDGGVDVDDSAACEIEHAPAHEEAIGAPCHVPDGEVGEDEPKGGENEDGGEFHPLGEGSDDEGWGDDGEGHLKHDEDGLGDVADEAVDGHAFEECLVEAADEGISIGGGEGIAEDDPQQAHDAGDGKALDEDAEGVFGADEAGVEKGEAGEGHQEHEGGGNDDPTGVSGIRCGDGGFFGTGGGCQREADEGGGQNTADRGRFRVHFDGLE